MSEDRPNTSTAAGADNPFGTKDDDTRPGNPEVPDHAAKDEDGEDEIPPIEKADSPDYGGPQVLLLDPVLARPR
eukprot:1366691-Pyramimonas_sp.AAC.1